ncbi:MAG: phosphatase PAP2 family protein [Pseudomonadota bacterium]
MPSCLSRLLVCAAVIGNLIGCDTVRNSLPTVKTVIQSTSSAALEPATWAPLAGAAILGATGWDKDLSDWAAIENPVFGSQENAASASDILRDGLVGGMVTSSFLAPVNGAYHNIPARRVAANAMAFGTASAVVNGLKGAVGRQRPNNGNDRSFPSGHAVAAFTSGSLIEQNLNQNIHDPRLQASIKAGSLVLATATAWARVEGKKHFPADVLVSAAIGNFFARSFFDAFVSADESDRTSFALEATQDSMALRYTRSF